VASARRSRTSLPRIALLVETQISAGRDMLRGIARYARESGPWAMHHEPRQDLFVEGWVPKWLRQWQGDGVIGRFHTDSIVAAVRAADASGVDVLGTRPDHPFPFVGPDNFAIGRLAANHLIERGFRQFGFIGWRNERWSDERRRAFEQAVNDAGYPCALLELRDFRNLAEQWDKFIEEVSRWMRYHPKPLGLMLCYDAIGPAVTQACRQVGVAVPEEVAIIGVDNDDPLCAICDPPLSSVCPNHEEVGYQAAAMLDRMRNGERVAAKTDLLIEPRTVVVRQSTSISAIEDPVISAALKMIREHACSGLQVADVAEGVPVSRSVLQRRFQAALGRSVHDEIVRVQMGKAQELLKDSDLPVRTIAEKAGFKHPEYMAAVFKMRLGMTPGSYRRKHQRAAASTVAAEIETSKS
jgi:LacI family transcriptional regulator